MPESVAPLKMKPCPCCDYQFPRVVRHELAYVENYVKCNGCGLKTRLFETEAEAIAAWNKRAEDVRPPDDAGLAEELISTAMLCLNHCAVNDRQKDWVRTAMHSFVRGYQVQPSARERELERRLELATQFVGKLVALANPTSSINFADAQDVYAQLSAPMRR